LDVPTDLVTTSCYAKAFEHGAHRTAGDDAGTGRSGANRDLAGAEVALAVMVQRAARRAAERGSIDFLPRSRLGDGFRHFARLAMTKPARPLPSPTTTRRESRSACRPSRS
jgi:hypothetical protein